MRGIRLSKKGEKGGDVKFERLRVDIRNHLLQRADTFITTMVDYYGLKEWPEKEKIPAHSAPEKISKTLCNVAYDIIRNDERLAKAGAESRFVPFVMVHEFEALLYSDATILAKAIGISQELVDKVISECGSPEQVNNSPQTAPSKRLEHWSNNHYGKTTMGIKIAQQIGIVRMREHCPLFNQWLKTLEQLVTK